MHTSNWMDEFTPVLEAPRYQPCVSIILPFNPKMGLKKEVSHRLKLASQSVKVQMESQYPSALVSAVLVRLEKVIDELNFMTHKQSVAIFVSPLLEKVYYLDVAVEEKIVVDQSFEIRDLVYSKKEIHKYLLAVLSHNQARIFLGNTTFFLRMAQVHPDRIEAYRTDLGEKVANFSDEKEVKEVLLEKFLRHVDQSLAHILHSYPLPLFVMGTERTAGHFRKLTQHGSKVVEYIHGNYEESTEPELNRIMQPYLTDWKKLLQKKLMAQVEESRNARTLTCGIREVWKSSLEKKGRLLIVEKNYYHPARQGNGPDDLIDVSDIAVGGLFIKDAVDDVIEKVIAGGGDVEFVDEGMLREWNRIVLIGYY